MFNKQTPVTRLVHRKQYFTREANKALRKVLVEKVNDKTEKVIGQFDNHIHTIQAISHTVRKG